MELACAIDVLMMLISNGWHVQAGNNAFHGLCITVCLASDQPCMAKEL
jgi:hypothetical protein